MGLCKCPKKKVTNLFCFEHRVNVCEHCLVSNHPKCIVQSYLQWLQDSDYNPACTLCNHKLTEDECGSCVRLICYDVFHWRCLDAYARRLPANTAPAGYTCPTCKSGLFPAANVVSPVAEALRQLLAQVNWARAGLGMPLIEEPPPPSEPAVRSSESQATHALPNAAAPHQQPPPPASSQAYSTQTYSSQSHSVVSVDEATPYARGTDKTEFNPRKLFDSTSVDDMLNMSHDHDEDKYKRRPALQWLTRWFKSSAGKQKKDPNASFKRFAIVLILGIVGFLTLVVIFTRVGRASADNDPFLDPMANPNIRIQSD